MRALIVGVTGQDGTYLAQQLHNEGCEVFGVGRRFKDPYGPAAFMIHADLLDQDSLQRALAIAKPDVVYNLAAVTSPGGAWGTPQPPLLADVTAVGVVRLLDAMLAAAPDARLVHASSSAIYDPHRYGLYGISKQFAHGAVQGYRDRLRCSNAVLFSHTSPRQDPRFLAPRICATLARGERLVLGDVESRRDWGYAPDYCRAIRAIAARDMPGDWVVATGVTHSVRELTEVALRVLGRSWDEAVTVDPTAPPVPNEVSDQEGRLATARRVGWKAETGMAEMVELMVRALA